MKLTLRNVCLSCACALSYFTSALSVSAQIVPDKTLPVNSTVTKTGLVHTINGGTTVGVNLYHSFQDFSVPMNNTAYFNNPSNVQNVLTRVTGNSVSNIDGTLKANGNANLYLLNPNGIIFGANAKLDIGGSFSASTANSFKFPDGSVFSATNPQAPLPLLTMDITPGLQYGTSNAGATISNSGNLSAGQDLVLNADKLDLQGTLRSGRDLALQAQDTVKIRDTVTTPFVASSGRDMTIQGNNSVDIFALSNLNSGFLSVGNMLLQSSNPITGDAYYYTGGNLRIENLNGNLGNLLSPNDPIIRANGDVSFASYTGASLHIFAGGSVTVSGDIIINGAETTANFIQENVILSDGKTIVPINGGVQPTLDIRAGTQAVGIPLGLTGNPSPIGLNLSNVPSSADINIGGQISINTGSNGLLLLTNNYLPNGLPSQINLNGGANQISGQLLSVYIDSRSDINVNQTINVGASGINKGGDITLLAGNSVFVNPT